MLLWKRSIGEFLFEWDGSGLYGPRIVNPGKSWFDPEFEGDSLWTLKQLAR